MVEGEGIYKDVKRSLVFKEYDVIDFLGSETYKLKVLKPNSEFLGYVDIKLNKFVLKDEKGYYSIVTRTKNLEIGKKVKIRYIYGDFEILEVGM
ncbi:hypothetical protein HNP92_001015 [Methanococcus maripaludis]|uniref:Uncharacterized protein n=1 Tax=Methanococcus maripaludis TaxID=39152 RepID=A0A7J9S5X7_METMI|nr:hypothetical protein [Methanococcus maripaludis]MBB6401710.1 hypothetical protein [Methanococcus maripaludis]